MEIRRIHSIAGLIVAAYVVPHLLNHAVGLISLDAMEAVRKGVRLVWHNPIGTPVLVAAFLTHFVLALWSLYTRSTFRMPAWEAIRIALGLMIFPLILTHVTGTLFAGVLLKFEPTYEYVVASLWVVDPWRGLQQSVLLLVVWAHLCMGLHFWLRLKEWYRRILPYAYAAAVLIPVLALLGFANAGREVSARAEFDASYLSTLYAPFFDPAMSGMMGKLKVVEPNGWIAFALIVAAGLVARAVRHAWRVRHGTYRLTLPDGRKLSAPVGQTVLDTLRIAGVPHASVCGGRGRCTTCRIYVGAAANELPAPGEIEARALARIMAEPTVRLACQTCPAGDLAIKPLLPPSASARDANRPGMVLAREQEVAILFLDIRGSTRLGERKLPYDVLFTLNQFFAEMSAALAETGGHYSNFTGDGLMAMYGVSGSIEEGCRNAVAGAAAMARRLDELNQRLAHDLPEPLRMGLGIHCGEVIVGSMGPPTAQTFTAIGDAVNVTARLESLTKDFGCALVLSEDVARRAGLDMGAHPKRTTGVRGRVGEINVYAIEDPRSLAATA
jgi:adenylate cyclase